MKTAMQQLLDQMREERTKLPLPIEWDRCYQAIEMMIQNTYMQIEKEEIKIGPIIGKPDLGISIMSSVFPIKAFSIARHVKPNVLYAATSEPKQA